MPLKLLHLADVHLDAPFGWLGRKGPDQRRQLAATFRSAIDLALAENVDAVLIAGDLFDSNSPAQSSVDLVRAELRRLARPTFILPGTHDRLDAGSIYRRVDFENDPNVHVFRDGRLVVEIGALGLAVHARANETQTSTESPLRGLAPIASARHNVALAHGSLAMPGTEDDYPLSAVGIANSGFDYLALGHWHRCQEYSVGRTVAWYSGPPELLRPDEVGAALLVEFSDDGTRAHVTRRDIGIRHAKAVTLSLDATADTESLRGQLLSQRDPSLVLRATLTGVRPLGEPLDIAGLNAELAGEFYDLRIDDQTHPALDDDALAALPKQLVIGQFARRMSRLIAEAPDETIRRRAENSLQIGLALLQGRKVL